MATAGSGTAPVPQTTHSDKPAAPADATGLPAATAQAPVTPAPTAPTTAGRVPRAATDTAATDTAAAGALTPAGAKATEMAGAKGAETAKSAAAKSPRAARQQRRKAPASAKAGKKAREKEPVKVRTLNDVLRELPRVDDLLGNPEIYDPTSDIPRALARMAIREALDIERRALREEMPDALDLPALTSRVRSHVQASYFKRLRSCVNATGIVVHTNLGRAPLSLDVAMQVAEIASHYSTLEFDIHTGERGSRHSLVEHLLTTITGAQAACVVNNNAAAVLLVLSEFARGKEVIVSRGELIEIGGSFRIPDIMALSGARMVEVGTTNKTHMTDYERAITPDTAMILKVHPSNYRVVGFHEEVKPDALVDLARKHNLMVFEDQGSGMLVDLAEGGIANNEHTANWSIAQGIDVVSCSGDKLLGASQAGIILGSAELIGRIKENPFMRAMRPDKLTLAALEATLRDYLEQGRPWQRIPVLQMLSMTETELKRRARRLGERLAEEFVKARIPRETIRAVLEVRESSSFAGGGSLPTNELPTWVVTLDFPGHKATEVRHWLLNNSERPVVTRVENERIVCDVRTLVDVRDENDLVDALVEAFKALH